MIAAATDTPCPVRRYKYLYPTRDGSAPERLPSDVLSTSMTTDTLKAGAFVVRDEGHPDGPGYLQFASRDQFWGWQDALPPHRRNFHEVVFGDTPQRLKFDIDATPAEVDRLDAGVLDRLTPGWLAPEEQITTKELDFDLDCVLYGQPTTRVKPPPLPATTQNKANAMVEYMVGVIVDAFTSRYPDRPLTDKDVLVMSSLLPGASDEKRTPLGEVQAAAKTAKTQKYSYHLVVAPYSVADHHEAKAFTQYVIALAKEECPQLAAFIDPQVNNRTQTFRLSGSQKPGSHRPKIMCPVLAARLQSAPPIADCKTTITQPPTAQVLPKQAEAATSAPAESLTDEDERRVLACARANLASPTSHRYRRRVGRLFIYERVRPSFCTLCERIHDNDNTLMLLVAPAEDGVSSQKAQVTELCRHGAGKGNVLGEVECTPGAFPAASGGNAEAVDTKSQTRIEAQIAALAAGRRDPARYGCDHSFDDLPSERKVEYNSPAMQPYALVDTLAVKAQVGVGKTRQLRAHLDAHYPQRGEKSLDPPFVIRFVTFRQTFSESLRKSFPEFVVYSDVQSRQINAGAAPRLIVQVESLGRLLADCSDTAEPVDLLIFDESESILAQFSSGLHQSFNEAFATFQWLLKNSRRVICLDANLSDRTFRTLARGRPEHPAHYHCNAFSRAAGDTVNVTVRRAVWLDQLLAQLGNDKRVVVASSSLREAKAVLHLVAEMYPRKKTKLYSSETPQGEKVLHFADVNTYWNDLDVLVYTPTVSAGVSYERAGFDCMFAFLSPASCDVETARQMLGRVRALRDKTFYVCIPSNPGASYPTDIAVLERYVYERREFICANHESRRAPSTVEFDPKTATIRPYRSAFFPLWLENCRITNLSRNDYAGRFVDQVATTGAKVVYLTPEPGSEDAVKHTNKIRKSAVDAVDAAADDRIVAAPDVPQSDVVALQTRIREAASGRASGPEITAVEVSTVRRFYLRNTYKWAGAIDRDFVHLYDQTNVKEVHRNLQIILWGPSEAASLVRLHDQERKLYNMSAAGASVARYGFSASRVAGFENADIRHRYRYPAHCWCYRFVRLCGFDSILDPAEIPVKGVWYRLYAGRAALGSSMESILQEFGIRHPGYEKMASSDPKICAETFLAVFNAALRKTYGVVVKKCSPSEPRQVYSIARTPTAKLFVWPNIPADPSKPTVGAGTLYSPDPDREFWEFIEWVYYEFLPDVAPADQDPGVPSVEAATAAEAAANIADAWTPTPQPPEPARRFVSLDAFLEDAYSRQ
jgi:hypothetical protein